MEKPAKKKNELSLATLAQYFANEDKAREFLESKRWPDGAICPHCQTDNPYKLTPKAGSKTRKGLYKCRACRKQFTVKVGTIFEDSKIQIRKWLMTIHLMCSSKKGVSAKQIEREVDVTYKTAWFMCHRIREAMKSDPSSLLGGGGKTVQTDETYVGGKAKNAHGDKIPPKSAVHVLVENKGNMRARVMDRVTSDELKSFVAKHVDINSRIVSDDLIGYRGLNTPFAKGHGVVKHGRKEYKNKRGETTNTAESFNALLKRGHYGVFHQMSRKHLPRYVDEFAFRWNTRDVTDGERMVELIEQTKGKRLRYQ